MADSKPSLTAYGNPRREGISCTSGDISWCGIHSAEGLSIAAKVRDKNKRVWGKGFQVMSYLCKEAGKVLRNQTQPHSVRAASTGFWGSKDLLTQNALSSSSKHSWIRKKGAGDRLTGSSNFFGNGYGYANTKTPETWLNSLGCINQ